MGNRQQKSEWTANADLCRRMAERSNDPVLRTRWATLAQQWLQLCESAAEPQTDTEQFETAVHHKAKGQPGSVQAN